MADGFLQPFSEYKLLDTAENSSLFTSLNRYLLNSPLLSHCSAMLMGTSPSTFQSESFGVDHVVFVRKAYKEQPF